MERVIANRSRNQQTAMFADTNMVSRLDGSMTQYETTKKGFLTGTKKKKGSIYNVDGNGLKKRGDKGKS